ncbi:MAG: type II toxin-antitoxin system Phd/YefM family antitoxin [Cyclobacteriaceae bacterium]
MKVTSYSHFRQNLKSFMDSVIQDSAPVYVTRNQGEDLVLISKSDYDSMQETLYLLSSPTNAQRLNEGIRQYESSQIISKSMDDLEE